MLDTYIDSSMVIKKLNTLHLFVLIILGANPIEEIYFT
jgi:hypothetical protein